jgi:ATP-dependent RNA helicase SUPV3L1/SUV3
MALPLLKPRLVLVGAEHASEPERNAARERLEFWLARVVASDLRPLVALEAAWAEGRLPPDARGLAFRLVENAGALDAEHEDLRHVSASARHVLARLGVRIGRHAIFMPRLIRPRAAQTLAVLRHALLPGQALFLPRAGALSAEVERQHHWGACAAAGYRVCGRIALRFDIVEKLGDALAQAAPIADAALARLIGRPQRELSHVLGALGYRRVEGAEGARWVLKQTRQPSTPTKETRGEGNAFAVLAELVPPPPARRRRRKRA